MSFQHRAQRPDIISKAFFLALGLVVGHILTILEFHPIFIDSALKRPFDYEGPQDQVLSSRESDKTEASNASKTPIQNESTGVQAEWTSQQNKFRNQRRSRILCFILTSPATFHVKSKHAAETWGKRCDKLLLMSSKADKKLGIIGLRVNEGYYFLWAKTREAFKYIYDNYRQEYDWVMKADDDTYCIVGNLRYFLRFQNPDDGHYFGSHHNVVGLEKGQGQNPGGPGYVLSMTAVTALVTEGFSEPETLWGCPWWRDHGWEDQEIAACLRNLRIFPGQTVDALGRHTFLPLALRNHVIPPEFQLEDNSTWDFFYERPKLGLDGLAPNLISVHRAQVTDMYMMEYLLYHLEIDGVSRSHGVI